MATPVSSEWNLALAGPHKTVVYADAWLGAKCLRERLPIVGGAIRGTRSSVVKYSLDLTVGSDSGRLTPHTPDAALNRYGQRLFLRGGIRYGDPDDASGRDEEIVPLGWFRIEESAFDEDWTDYPTIDGLQAINVGSDIEVSAQDMSVAVSEDQFLQLSEPQGTVFGETRRLLGDTMPFGETRGVIDRRVPATVTYQDDKLKAIDDMAQVADAFPAANVRGGLDLIADRITTPAWAVDASRQTLKSMRQVLSRSDLYNAVISSGNTEDNAEVSAVAYERYGPIAFHGPFGRKAQRHSSPLIDSETMAQADANTTLQRLTTRRVVTLPIVAPTNFALRIGDTVQVNLPGGRGDASAVLGQLVDFGMPLTPGDMTMSVDVPLDEIERVRRGS